MSILKKIVNFTMLQVISMKITNKKLPIEDAYLEKRGHQDMSKQENQLNKTKAREKKGPKAVRHTESNKITKLKLSIIYFKHNGLNFTKI